MHLGNKIDRSEYRLVRDEKPSWGRKTNQHLEDGDAVYLNDGDKGEGAENRVLGKIISHTIITLRMTTFINKH